MPKPWCPPAPCGRKPCGARRLTVLPAITPGALRDPAEAVGLEAGTTLYANRPIRPEDLGPAALIDRNQIVTLSYGAGLLDDSDRRPRPGARRRRRCDPGDEPGLAHHSFRPYRRRWPRAGRPNPLKDVHALSSACQSLPCRRAPAGSVGKAPDFTPIEGGYQHHAMYATPLPRDIPAETPTDASSLWTADRASLFGERRAQRRGDIMTVVIAIDDSAEISNTSGRSRAGSDTMGMPSLFGIPQRLNEKLPEGASMAEAVNTSSASNYRGYGTVSRNEKLGIAGGGHCGGELPNGVLRIEGQQEVRVNYELRELIVSGYVRPTDISRPDTRSPMTRFRRARVLWGPRPDHRCATAALWPADHRCSLALLRCHETLSSASFADPDRGRGGIGAGIFLRPPPEPPRRR